MNYIKQKHHKLSHIINNCKTTQSQLTELKRTLKNETLFNPLNKQTVKPRNSVSLLRYSRIHMDEFQKIRVQMTSFDGKSNFQQLNKILQIDSKINCNKQKQRRFNQIVTCPKGQQIQAKNQAEPYYQNQTLPVTPTGSKQKEKNQNYLPNIKGAFMQTFSPKNASLSQYSMALKQLQRSVHKKEHQERCKKYNKENVLREYENRKHHNDEKIEIYRLNILKKISCDNVKKYLINKTHIKARYGIVEGEKNALHRSCHEKG